jgi:hypothetical protein
VPTFSFGAYFFNTLSLWYYEFVLANTQVKTTMPASNVCPPPSLRRGQNMRALCKDTYLPELLARILSTNPLQYFCTTRVFFREGIHLVYVVVDYDIKTVVNSVVFRDLLGGEGLRHGDVGIATPCTRGGCWQSNKDVVQL